MACNPIPHPLPLAAVSNIGVDVEVSAPRKRTASIAPRVLTEKERCVVMVVIVFICLHTGVYWCVYAYFSL